MLRRLFPGDLRVLGFAGFEGPDIANCQGRLSERDWSKDCQIKCYKSRSLCMHAGLGDCVHAMCQQIQSPRVAGHRRSAGGGSATGVWSWNTWPGARETERDAARIRDPSGLARISAGLPSAQASSASQVPQHDVVWPRARDR